MSGRCNGLVSLYDFNETWLLILVMESTRWTQHCYDLRRTVCVIR
jgi:hypothetical protein